MQRASLHYLRRTLVCQQTRKGLRARHWYLSQRRLPVTGRENVPAKGAGCTWVFVTAGGPHEDNSCWMAAAKPRTHPKLQRLCNMVFVFALPFGDCTNAPQHSFQQLLLGKLAPVCVPAATPCKCLTYCASQARRGASLRRARRSPLARHSDVTRTPRLRSQKLDKKALPLPGHETSSMASVPHDLGAMRRSNSSLESWRPADCRCTLAAAAAQARCGASLRRARRSPLASH